jgi:hypothetical protein
VVKRSKAGYFGINFRTRANVLPLGSYLGTKKYYSTLVLVLHRA